MGLFNERKPNDNQTGRKVSAQEYRGEAGTIEGRARRTGLRPKATSLLKFGWCMLALNAWASLLFKWLGDPIRADMFLVGALFWLFGCMVWLKNVEDEEDDEDQ